MSNKENVLVILGTSRNESNTLGAIYEHIPFKDFEIVKLHKKTVLPFDYILKYEDDFIPIAQQMLKADIIVFATPVYWYSMSATLKIFFDRLTDLTTTSKEIGRGLAGKKVYLLATGSDRQLPEGFEVPFKKTCDYFNMNYVRSFYISTNYGVKNEVGAT